MRKPPTLRLLAPLLLLLAPACGTATQNTAADWRWSGPTPLQSSRDLRDPKADAARAPTTTVEVRSATPATAMVTDAFGTTRRIEVPGTFSGSGPVRVRIDFAADDFFERVVVLPEDRPGPTVTLEVPQTKSAYLIAGQRRVPVSRGIKVVLPGAIPALDLAARSDESLPVAGQPNHGPRWVAPGKPGVEIRQVLFHTTLTDTVKQLADALVGRGLSTHLAVERDGTVYQLLDLELSGYHAGEANNHAIGFDWVGWMPNLARVPVVDGIRFREQFDALPPERQQRWREAFTEASARLALERARAYGEGEGTFDADDEALYLELEALDRLDDDGKPRPIEDELPRDPNAGIADPGLHLPLSAEVELAATVVQSFGPSPLAMRSITAVVGSLLDHYPSIARSIPVDASTGRLVTKALPDNAWARWGLVGHFHTESQRWDPGPAFSWQDLANLLLLKR